MASFPLAFHYVAAPTTRRSKVNLQINAVNREIVKHQLLVRLSPYTPAMFPAYLANNLNETRASYRKSHVPLFIEAALLTTRERPIQWWDGTRTGIVAEESAARILRGRLE